MKCDTVQELLPKYQDGDLIAEQHSIVEEHLCTCESCAGELAQLERVVELVVSLESLDAPADFTTNVMASITGELEEETERPVIGWWLAATGLAVSVLGILIGSLGLPADATAGIAPVLQALLQGLGGLGAIVEGAGGALLAATRAHGGLVFLVDVALLALILANWRRLLSIRLRRATASVMVAL